MCECFTGATQLHGHRNYCTSHTPCTRYTTNHAHVYSDADKIEGYDPKAPTASPYMRKVVEVTPIGGGDTTAAYMYVCSPTQPVEPDWRVIPSGNHHSTPRTWLHHSWLRGIGDWLQRHTAPVALRASATSEGDLPSW